MLHTNLRKAVLATCAVFVLGNLALAEDIELVSGEVIKANVIERGSSTTIIDHPILGVFSVDNSKIKNIAETGIVKIDTATGEAATPAKAAAAAKAKKKEEKPLWQFAAEFGASGSSGNSDTFNLHAAVRGKSDNEDRRWTFDAEYNKAEVDDEKTKSNFFAQTQYDFKLKDSPWFPFARARYDYDEFTDWDARVEVGAGVGREVAKGDNYSVRGRAGLNGVREFGGADDSWRLEAMLGADADWDINETQNLTASFTVFQDLEDTEEYRTLFDAGWSIVLDAESSMNLKIGVSNEYDSRQDDPFEKNDFTYYIALAFKF